MTIYELEKQATPGPWYKHEHVPFLYVGENIPKTQTSRSWVASFFMWGAGRRNQENARLSAHCRNNFMRALEALKVEHGALEMVKQNALSTPTCPSGCPVCELIAELEEVS